VKRNHQVTVLTGKPNYPDGILHPEFHKNPTKFDQYEGAEIIRVPTVVRGQGNSFQLLMNYFSFVFTASLWGWVKLRKLDFDVIFVFEPSPITVGLPAVFLKKMNKIPIVFWALDLWPETLEAVGAIKSKTLINLIGKMVSFIYNRCDLVLGQSKSFLDGIATYCTDPDKIKYFPSWPEDIFLGPATRIEEDIAKYNGVFKVLFAGNVGAAQDFPSLIHAAEVLKNNNANVKLFVVGDGRMLSRVKQQIEEKGLKNYVYLLGRFPLEEMPGFYAAADALLVSLKRNRIFSMTIPGKLQSYMMAGKPILAMLDGEGARIVSEAKAGYTCSSENYKDLAENIIAMSRLDRPALQELGSNAKTFAQREFERNKLITQLEHWFSEIAYSNQNIIDTQ